MHTLLEISQYFYSNTEKQSVVCFNIDIYTEIVSHTYTGRNFKSVLIQQSNFSLLYEYIKQIIAEK